MICRNLIRFETNELFELHVIRFTTMDFDGVYWAYIMVSAYTDLSNVTENISIMISFVQ